MGDPPWDIPPKVGSRPPERLDKSIPQGAATTVWAAVANDVPRGEYLDDCAVASQRSDQAKDDALADALWDATESRLDAAVAKRGL